MSLSFVFPKVTGLSILRRLFLYGRSHITRLVINRPLSDDTILAGVQFELYAAKEAAPEVLVRSSHFGYVGGCMIPWLPIFLVNVLSHVSFHKLAEMMRIDPAFAVLAFHHATEIDCSLPGGSAHFLPYSSLAM